MKPARFLAIAFAALLLAGGCGGGDSGGGETARGGVLPRPDVTGGMALDRTLSERDCVRSFSPARLEREQVSQLLWSAAGHPATDSVTGATGPAPSAGGIYPLEIYHAEGGGACRYIGATGLLEPVAGFDDEALRRAAGTVAEAAPALFVFAADVAKSSARYGERAWRYVCMEAGHAAQNMLLEAVSLGLGACPIGAFDDGAVARSMGLPPGLTPLYVVAVGRPR